MESLHDGSCLDEEGGLRRFEVGYGSFHVINCSLDSKKLIKTNSIPRTQRPGLRLSWLVACAGCSLMVDLENNAEPLLKSLTYMSFKVS